MLLPLSLFPNELHALALSPSLLGVRDKGDGEGEGEGEGEGDGMLNSQNHGKKGAYGRLETTNKGKRA